MKKNNQKNSDIQNHFTAYLVTAIQHTKIEYGEKKTRLRQHEIACAEEYSWNYTDFDREFVRYISEQYYIYFRDLDKMQELLWPLEGGKLVKVLKKLKEQERQILFSRIFGEQSFTDIGQELDMTPDQARAAYFYALRKLRKELGVKKDGI